MSVRKTAAKFEVNPSTVQRISRPFGGAEGRKRRGIGTTAGVNARGHVPSSAGGRGYLARPRGGVAFCQRSFADTRIRSSAAAPDVRSRRHRNCSDNDQPDEDSSGHEVHIQALEALNACRHDCRYCQKAPSDNKRDKGFQCQDQRPVLNCPKKI
jgi:hypothetical protein